MKTANTALQVLAASLLMVGCRTAVDTELAGFNPRGKWDNERPYGAYTVRTYLRETDLMGSVVILYHGRIIYAEHGGRYFLEYSNTGLYGPIRLSPPAWTDITGNGRPDIVTFEEMGGGHGPSECTVVEVHRGRCTVLAKIEAPGGAVFEDLDGDGTAEVKMGDYTFDYWPSCHAGAPVPMVVLRWSGKDYRVAADLMLRPAPPRDQLSSLAASVRRRPEWGQEYDRVAIPPRLFSIALDLMYTGHEALGWQFIQEAWPPRFPMDTELLDQLRDLLNQSPYWTEFARQTAKH